MTKPTLFIFKFYISGVNQRNQEMSDRLKTVLDKECPDEYVFEIIDVLKSPQRAEDAKIFVTPVLIKQLPPPVRRVIGDIKNEADIFLHLGIVPKKRES